MSAPSLGQPTNPHRISDYQPAIRADQPYNKVERGAMATLVTSMGRFAAHTGQKIPLEEMLAHDHEFAPDLDKLAMDSAAPLVALADGSYPVPEPGRKKHREY